MGYSSTSTLVYYCLAVILVSHSVTSQQGVILLWQGIQYPNNSVLNIEDIGEGERALICQTDRRPCCGVPPYRVGEWYYPGGRTVPVLGQRELFYRNRNDEGQVLLHQRARDSYPTTGLFCCVLPDANDISYTLCIGLLPKAIVGGVGGYSITGLSYNTTSFTLSCITSGGIATFVNGDGCNSEQELVEFSQPVLDPVALRYDNMLRCDTQSQGNYICSTRRRAATSYAVLLTEFGAGQGSCSSQIIGTLGRKLTLLCLGNEPVKDAVWTTGGERNSSNITFTHVTISDAGVYICRGTVRDQAISAIITLRISRCSAVVYVSGNPVANTGQSYTLTCNTFHWETGCIEDEFYFFRGNKLISRNKTLTIGVESVSGVLNNYYSCIVTLNGSNFTSNSARISTLIQLPAPLSVSISSDVDNPLPYGSSPTLSCTISLSPAIDVEIETIIEWSGPVYGLGKFTITQPVLNSSAEVPTYTSTATLNVSETFYDSGQYYCSVVVNPSLINHDHIRSTPVVSSPRFSAPRRPSLHGNHQVSHNWIYISWNENSAADNITNYEVRYSYIGECSGISRHIITQKLDVSKNSFNITDIGGYYLNYSINLTAINDTGRSPPNIAFVVTASTAPTGAPQVFTPAMVFSTNITMQWQRVICSERNSEITNYTLQYSLEGSDRVKNVNILGTNDSSRMYTATRLQSLSRYTLTIAAVNSDGQTGPNRTVTVVTAAPESVAFQIQLNGVHSCLQWRIGNLEDKVHDVLVGISSGINQHCPHCEIEHTNITDGEFQCFPGSPNQVTFRANVHDRAQATAREVIMFIEQWVTSAGIVSIPVHHARLIINSSCVILLSSLDDPECPGYLTPPSPEPITTSTSDSVPYVSTDSMTPFDLTMGLSLLDRSQTKGENLSPVDTKQPQSGIDTGAIVGGAVAIVFIITTGAVMIFLLYSVLKYHRTTITQSTPKILKLDENPHRTTVSAKPAAEEDESDETYEVVETKKVTSAAKAMQASAATNHTGGHNCIPMESEVKKDSSSIAHEENQEEDEAYINF